MDTISLIHGGDFDNSFISKIKNSKIFVFDYSSFKTIEKYNFEYFFADEFLTKLDREKIHDHVVSKLYWYEDQKLSNNNKQLFQFLDPLYLLQKLLVTLIQFSIIKKMFEQFSIESYLIVHYSSDLFWKVYKSDTIPTFKPMISFPIKN